MTSISAASGSNYQSPLQLLQAELQSEVPSPQRLALGIPPRASKNAGLTLLSFSFEDR